MGAIGIARTVAVTTTAQRNSTALPYGRYIVRLDGSPTFVLQGGSTITVTSTTGQRMRDGDAWEFDVDDSATGAYLSLMTETGTATAYVSRTDTPGIATQPSAWA